MADHPEIDEARALRVLLAEVIAGFDLETPEGELVDDRLNPVIDFGRDPVDEIREKLFQRAVFAAMRGEF